MSFLGGSSKNLPAPAPVPLGIQEERVNTNEQARPIPYLAGKTRIGLTWISEAINQRADPVTTTTGGKGGGTYTSGYNYYASIAGLICWGPLDGIHAIYANGDLVWSGDVTRGAEDYVDITVENYGTARLYWGTATQAQDAELASSGYDHPPYLHQAYLRLLTWFFGFNQTSVQNIEVVVSRYPAISWMTAAVNLQGDCNPVAIVAEWLQDGRFGLGWGDALLDTAALDAVADTLETEGLGVSPIITKQTGARQLLQQLCEYIDAVTTRTAAGKFSLVLIRDPGAVATLDEDDLTDEPDFDPDSVLSARAKTWIKFLNADNNYKEDALPYRDPGVFQQNADNTSQTIERLWVTRPALAQQMVAAAGRTAALPHGTGTLRVKKASAAALDVGSAFELSYTHWGITDLLLRITRKTIPRPGSQEVTLEVASDRAYLSDAFYVPDDDVPPTPQDLDPEAITDQLLIELPRGLAVAEQITVAPLAARPNRQTNVFLSHLLRQYAISSAQPNSILGDLATGWFIDGSPDYGTIELVHSGAVLAMLQVAISAGFAAQLASLASSRRLVMGVGPATGGLREVLTVVAMTTLSSGHYTFVANRYKLATTHTLAVGDHVYFADNATAIYTASYEFLAEHNRFARHGALGEDYAATTDRLDQSVGLLITLDNADITLDDLTLTDAQADRLLLFVDDEIISVSGVTLVGAGQYRVYGIRGRYDTRPQAHSTGAEAWLIERARLGQLTDATFTYLATINLKLQPSRLGNALDLADATAVELTLGNRVAKPLAPLNLAHAGDGHIPFYTTGQDLTLTWDLASAERGGFWSLWGNPVAAGLPYVVLKFYTTAGVLKETVETAAAAESHTYTNAALVSAFGSEQSVVVRAYARHGDNLQSLFYDELTINLR